MKISTLYTCTQCSYQSSKWIGRCPQCEAWNSFSEEQVKAPSANQKKIKAHARAPKEFDELVKNLAIEVRQSVGIVEVDRVLGGGIIPGSLLLLAGEPGIGKSTLTLQIADRVSSIGKKVLYVSGEESEEQISLRGKRLGLGLKGLLLISETNLETILATATEQKPDFLIIDSIQVVSSQGIPGGPGSVSQVRLCAEAIMEFAKPKKLSVLLIGHVTKDGTLAGPRVLEHLVDGVFMFEGDRSHDLRLLRGLKNRFGPTQEVGVFEMTEKGLSELKNPSAKFLEGHGEAKPGSALVCTVEGTRPFIVEVQALVSATRFGYPRRMTSGFDMNRLNLLVAVLEKHVGVNLGTHDVYINVVGGLKLQDPGCDLGVCVAILSSLKKKSLHAESVYIGEVGLNGEIRKTHAQELRKKEIEKFGFLVSPDAFSHILNTLVQKLM